MKSLASAFLVTCLLSGPVRAAEFELPDQVSWTTYARLGQEQALAIGEALRGAGVELRIQPADSDLARAELLRSGAVEFAATAVGGSVAAQEGVFDFAARAWGPQPVRMVLASTGERFTYAIAIAGDLGVETYAGLKGRRIAWYRDFPIVNVNTEAFLAYGGLTWDDVVRVEVAGFFDAALQALGEGRLDAAFAATSLDGAYQVSPGPRGLVWPRLDPDDTAAMDRLEAVAPYFVPHDATDNVGHQGAHYPFPILVALEGTDEALVYNMTKALVELFPQYQGKAFGLDGWHLDQQELLWFVPYHEGTVAYLRERGVWSDAAQAHHDDLVARQEALAAAWAALKAENPADWEAAWTERRHQALKDGGFQPVF
jgi:TRAP transporter TAXI family solute receptor